MASNNNTPISVLQAPSQSFEQLYTQQGLNRESRRHYRPFVEGNPETPPTLRHKPMIRATMEPAIKTGDDKRPRRGKKARKYGK